MDGLNARPCYQFVSAEGPVVIEPKDGPMPTKPLLAIVRVARAWTKTGGGIGTKCRKRASKRLTQAVAVAGSRSRFHWRDFPVEFVYDGERPPLGAFW